MSVPYLNLAPQYELIKEKVQSRFQQIFEHTQFIMGPEVFELEESLKSFVGCQQAIVCSNGTVALQMALMAAGVTSGDEVIVPAFSFFATAEAVNLVGATPVFVDVHADDFNIDPNKIEQAITPQTKAIIPVSLYGQTFDFEAINALAQKHHLVVIEDAAQSFGARHKKLRSGNLSELATTSFFPAKPLGGYGDGGAVFTNNEDLALKLRQIRDHGSEKRYHHIHIGMNGRLNTFQCAVLLEKLSLYEKEIELRNDKAQFYTHGLKGASKIQLPKVHDDNKSVWAQYTIQVDNRDLVQQKLKDLGIPTSVHYPSALPDQPVYTHQVASCRVSSTDTARELSQRVLSLPLYPYMPKEDQEKVILSLLKVI